MHLQSAQVAMNWCNYNVARRELDLCLTLRPSHGRTLLLAARAADRDGETSEATRLLAQAMLYEPDDAELENMVFQMRTGELGDTAGILDACAAQPTEPQSKLIMEGLIDGAIQTSQVELAQKCLEWWDGTQKEPWDAAQAATWRGELALRQSLPDVGIRFFRVSLKASPDCERARLGLAEALIQYSPTEARSHLELLKASRPDRWDILIRLASCQRELGEFDEANRILDRLISRSDKDVNALIERAKVALDLRQFAEAETWFRKAEKESPHMRDVQFGLARCLQMAGKTSEAQAYRDMLNRADEAADNTAKQ